LLVPDRLLASRAWRRPRRWRQRRPEVSWPRENYAQIRAFV
jgi:hypothetical protein